MIWDARRESGGSRRVLARTGLEYLANDETVDLIGCDAGLGERGLDGDATEVGGRE